jgi:hypothetical protein
LTCGLVLWKISFAIAPPQGHVISPCRGCVARLGTVVEQGRGSREELLVGVEPTTSSLPRTRSTTELCQQPALLRPLAAPIEHCGGRDRSRARPMSRLLFLPAPISRARLAPTPRLLPTEKVGFGAYRDLEGGKV